MYHYTYPGEQHWRGCTECNLHRDRRNVVLSRLGRCQLPPERDREPGIPRAFCIGEAPGKTEDVTGVPFYGEAGRLLNIIFSYVTEPMLYCITNVVSCKPPEGRTPSPQEISLCSPKVQELYDHFAPTCVIYVGKTAEAFKPPKRTPTFTMIHLAAIARMEYRLYTIKEQGLLLSRFLKEHRHALLNPVQRKQSSHRS